MLWTWTIDLFKINDKKLLKKYTKKWGKISSLIGKEFSSGSVYYGDNGEYIKTKIKSYGDNVNISFHGKKISKGNSSCKCL